MRKDTDDGEIREMHSLTDSFGVPITFSMEKLKPSLKTNRTTDRYVDWNDKGLDRTHGKKSGRVYNLIGCHQITVNSVQ